MQQHAEAVDRAVAALARSCTLDVERAAASLQHARRPRIHTFIATSEIHLKHKLKKSQQQVLDEAVAAVELADRAGTLFRLGFTQSAATTRLTARIAWEFDPPSKHGPHKRPDGLSDAAIAKIVADTYARRPGGW